MVIISKVLLIAWYFWCLHCNAFILITIIVFMKIIENNKIVFLVWFLTGIGSAVSVDRIHSQVFGQWKAASTALPPTSFLPRRQSAAASLSRQRERRLRIALQNRLRPLSIRNLYVASPTLRGKSLHHDEIKDFAYYRLAERNGNILAVYSE